MGCHASKDPQGELLQYLSGYHCIEPKKIKRYLTTNYMTGTVWKLSNRLFRYWKIFIQSDDSYQRVIICCRRVALSKGSKQFQATPLKQDLGASHVFFLFQWAPIFFLYGSPCPLKNSKLDNLKRSHGAVWVPLVNKFYCSKWHCVKSTKGAFVWDIPE